MAAKNTLRSTCSGSESAMLGNLIKFGNKRPEITPGSTFRHIGPGDLVETAKVVKITPDAMGIPHVRFEFAAQRNNLTFDGLECRRTLNIDSFVKYFSELVEA